MIVRYSRTGLVINDGLLPLYQHGFDIRRRVPGYVFHLPRLRPVELVEQVLRVEVSERGFVECVAVGRVLQVAWTVAVRGRDQELATRFQHAPNFVHELDEQEARLAA